MNGLPTPVSESGASNPVIDALTELSKRTRDLEEARLRKRQKRQQEASQKDKKDEGGSGSRTGSIALGTPGLAAPEETKAPTKKESKKAAAKAAEAASSVTVNKTLDHMFGGSKKKKYSWMSGGAAASGASTPQPKASGGSGASATASNGPALQGPLTQANPRPLGTWREDSAKGKHIQLRDWIHVLERNETDVRALQQAYNKLDDSKAGDTVAMDQNAAKEVPAA